MASSHVEIASSFPFGCVLTSHNGRDACTTHAKNITRDQVNTYNVPISSDSPAPNKHTQKPTWASGVAKNNHLGSLSFTRKLHNFRGDKDDSSLSALVSPRHSSIIDRWAARQAREVATTLQNGDVEVIEDFPSRSSSFTSRREVSLSPPRSDDSSDSEKISNLGASSLVQIWEKRLNKSNCTSKPNTPRASTPDHASCNESEEHCRVSVEGESSDEPFTDWESDQSYSSKALHCSDAAERERGRVADLIKRLTVTKQMQSDENDHELSNSVTGSPYSYRERDYPSTPKQAEHRRVFNDLIMQFDCDRHGELDNLAERGAVSKFTQRSRIQSLLRLRLLQRGVAAFDPSYKKPAASEGNKQEGSAIMQLKEIFNTGDEQRTSSLAVRSNPPGREIVSTTTKLDSFPTSKQISKDTGIHCEKHTQKNSLPQTSVDNKEEAYPSSDIPLQGTFFEPQDDDPKETVEASSSVADSNANDIAEKIEARDQQYDTAETSYDEIVEEEEVSDENCCEARASYDWVSSISRPRSYWEKLRQEWYSKMLDFGSENDERRKLLERRTVSSVLSSGFRKRMDKLMESHMGTEKHLVSNQYNEEDQEGSMEQLMAFFQERLHVRRSPQEDGRDRGEEEEVGRNEEEEKAEESIISGSDHELGGYQSSPSVHTPSSSTWSYRDNDGVDDSDRVASVSSLLPSQSQSFYQDTLQYSSSTNHHSIEMDVIYDLRGQMEQLFREMSELRKSINSCMDMQMQMQMQQSKNQEVHTVKKEKKFHNKTPKKGNCRICYEQKVNSVLYRCGHMCACLKCANELQWNSGKCPICQSPIIDVVQVHTDTESYMMDRVRV